MKKAFAAIVISAFFAALTVNSMAAPDINVSARSAVLMEADSRQIVFERDAHTPMPMASTTKIMTALVAIENGELDKTVSVSDLAIGVEGSSIYLKAGEKLTLRELLYAVLLESANDAATAVAVEIGGSVDSFAEMMNEKASELELENTHFTNPHGLDDEQHYTTAADLAKIAAAALENDTFKEIVSTYKTTIPGADYKRVLVNHNRLLKSYDGAIGVKTGFTKRCGRCLVSAAERDGVRLIAVTLSAPDDWRDHAAMLDYGFTQFECCNICDDDGLLFDIPCLGGNNDTVRVKSEGALSVTLPKNSVVTSSLEIRRFVWAPVKTGDYMGKVKYFSDGKEIASVDLYADSVCYEKTHTKSLFERIFG